MRDQPPRLPPEPIRSAMKTISRLFVAMLADDVPAVLTWGPALIAGPSRL